MGLLTSLFGGESGTSWWGAGFALIIVLVLIVAGLWALKLLFKASGSVARGRQRRLAVIDTLSVDGKRNLVLVRRDGVEHLLVIGGTHDVVVETGISTENMQTQRPERASPPAQRAAKERRQHDSDTNPDRRRTAAASRLGVTGLLRRYNEPQATAEPVVDTPQQSPLDRLKNLGERDAPRTAPTLRHTGLLRPASNDDLDDGEGGDFKSDVEEAQISVREFDDSVMNERDESDAEAMASIEEGAAAHHAGTEDAGTQNDGTDVDEFVGDGDPEPDAEKRH